MPYWIMWLSIVGNFAYTVDCLQYWLPTVFTNGTIGTNGITNGAIGRTLNDIGIPLVPLVERWTHAWFVKTHYGRFAHYWIQDRLYILTWMESVRRDDVVLQYP